jgi:hypothetical protein
MTTLRDELPRDFFIEFQDARANKFLDVEVIAQHRIMSRGREFIGMFMCGGSWRMGMGWGGMKIRLLGTLSRS